MNNLSEIEIRRKSKIMLHGYKQLHSLHKKKGVQVDTAKDVERRFDVINQTDHFLKVKKKKKINER